MVRGFLFLVAAISLAAAQSLEERMGTVRGKIAERIQGSSLAAPRSAGQKLADAVDGIRATLNALETNLRGNGHSADAAGTLRDERRKLLALDEAYQAEFARIEFTLRRAGLAQVELDRKLAIWHDFTAHYRQRMDVSLAGFERLSRGSPSQREIAALRASLGETSRPPKRLPAPPQESTPFNLPHPQAHDAAASDPPTSDELGETAIVKLSPDIRALAASLNASPTAIYAYVYNNIRYVPYLLAFQNS